jgi:hypothetical protein
MIFTGLFSVGESTIQDVPVQAGDNVTDYNVTVRVKIIDEFGDFALFETITQVCIQCLNAIKIYFMHSITIYVPFNPSPFFQILPPPKAQVTVNNVNTFFDDVLTSYSQAKAGGNDMAAMGVLGAAASLFDNVTNVRHNTEFFAIAENTFPYKHYTGTD